MKNARVITIASILIGFCLGIMIKSYINAPEDFVWMDSFLSNMYCHWYGFIYYRALEVQKISALA